MATVVAGWPFLCSVIGLALLDWLHANRFALGLSKHEMEVLNLVANDLTSAENALKFFVSKHGGNAPLENHGQNPN